MVYSSPSNLRDATAVAKQCSQFLCQQEQKLGQYSKWTTIHVADVIHLGRLKVKSRPHNYILYSNIAGIEFKMQYQQHDNNLSWKSHIQQICKKG